MRPTRLPLATHRLKTTAVEMRWPFRSLYLFSLYGLYVLTIIVITRVVGKGLFKRAMLLSGSALSRWAIVEDPRRSAAKLAAAVNCSTADPASVVSCLKAVPSAVLSAVPITSPKYLSPFGPVVDRRTVLTSDVDYLMRKAAMEAPSFEATSLLIGLSRVQSCASFLGRREAEHGVSLSRRTAFMRTFVQNLFRYHRQKLFDTLDYHYTNWERRRDLQVIRDGLLELLSDGLYLAPAVQVSRYHAALPGAPASFVYSFQSPLGAVGGWTAEGWSRASELAFLFGAPLVDGVSPFAAEYSPQEKALAEFGLKCWTNFVNFG